MFSQANVSRQCCHCRHWQAGGNTSQGYDMPQAQQQGGMTMMGQCLRSQQQGSRIRSQTPVSTTYDFSCNEFSISAPADSVTGIPNPHAPVVPMGMIGGSVGANMPIVLNAPGDWDGDDGYSVNPYSGY